MGDNKNDIPARIQRRRKELGLTQEDVAKRLGISLTAYRKIENGTTGLMNRRAEELSTILMTTPEYLLLDISSRNFEVVMEEYAKTFEEYERQNRELRESNQTLQELIKSKDEIIRLLKDKINEDKEQ